RRGREDWQTPVARDQWLASTARRCSRDSCEIGRRGPCAACTCCPSKKRKPCPGALDDATPTRGCHKRVVLRNREDARRALKPFRRPLEPVPQRLEPAPQALGPVPQALEPVQQALEPVPQALEEPAAAQALEPAPCEACSTGQRCRALAV